MNKAKADEIYQKVYTEWVRRHGEGKLNKTMLEDLRKFLEICPDEDGMKRVTILGETETHLVPYEDIMLNGLKGEDVKKYPVEIK